MFHRRTDRNRLADFQLDCTHRVYSDFQKIEKYFPELKMGLEVTLSDLFDYELRLENGECNIHDWLIA